MDWRRSPGASSRKRRRNRQRSTGVRRDAVGQGIIQISSHQNHRVSVPRWIRDIRPANLDEAYFLIKPRKKSSDINTIQINLANTVAEQMLPSHAHRQLAEPLATKCLGGRQVLQPPSMSLHHNVGPFVWCAANQR